MKLIKDNLSIVKFKEKMGIPFFEGGKTLVQNPTYEFMTNEEQEEYHNYLKKRAPDSNKPFGLYFFYEPKLHSQRALCLLGGLCVLRILVSYVLFSKRPIYFCSLLNLRDVKKITC